VEGYLGTTPLPCDAAETPAIGDVLDPIAYEACSWSWLSEDGSPAPVLNVPTPDSSSTASPRPSIDTLALTGRARHVWVGGARQIDSIPTATTHGVYVVRVATGPCPGASPIDSYGCPYWAVVAKVPGLTLDEPTATATPTASSGPSPEPPATPVTPEPSSSLVPGAALPGLIGPEGRPLTVMEFQNAWAADPDHLAGRIAITKGPVPTGFICWSAGAADASASPGTCHLGVVEGYVAQDGYWAVKVGADGKLSLLGELILTQAGRFVFTVDEAVADTSLRPADLLVVSGTLMPWAMDYCDVVLNGQRSHCYPPALLSGTSEHLTAELGTYEAVTGQDLGPQATGLFLIRRGTDTVTVLAAFGLSYPAD
jgi:hypothetical protein